jgi:hypothetical protein
MVSVGLGVSGRQLSTVMKVLLLSLLSSLGGPIFQLIRLFFYYRYIFYPFYFKNGFVICINLKITSWKWEQQGFCVI